MLLEKKLNIDDKSIFNSEKERYRLDVFIHGCFPTLISFPPCTAAIAAHFAPIFYPFTEVLKIVRKKDLKKERAKSRGVTTIDIVLKQSSVSNTM